MEQRNRQLKVNADLGRLDEVLSFLETNLEEAGCPLKLITQICISVEEIFVNIANYAYPQKGGECVLDFSLSQPEKHRKELKLNITDSGAQFNPLEKEDPDITLSAEDRQIGGLGIWMVKQSMDRVEYQYTDLKNQLTLIKTWDEESEEEL